MTTTKKTKLNHYAFMREVPIMIADWCTYLMSVLQCASLFTSPNFVTCNSSFFFFFPYFERQMQWGSDLLCLENPYASVPRDFSVVRLCDLCFKFNNRKIPLHRGTRIFGTKNLASIQCKLKQYKMKQCQALCRL